jgi:hypothetical protein
MINKTPQTKGLKTKLAIFVDNLICEVQSLMMFLMVTKGTWNKLVIMDRMITSMWMFVFFISLTLYYFTYGFMLSLVFSKGEVPSSKTFH